MKYFTKSLIAATVTLFSMTSLLSYGQGFQPIDTSGPSTPVHPGGDPLGVGASSAVDAVLVQSVEYRTDNGNYFLISGLRKDGPYGIEGGNPNNMGNAFPIKASNDVCVKLAMLAFATKSVLHSWDNGAGCNLYVDGANYVILESN